MWSVEETRRKGMTLSVADCFSSSMGLGLQRHEECINAGLVSPTVGEAPRSLVLVPRSVEAVAQFCPYRTWWARAGSPARATGCSQGGGPVFLAHALHSRAIAPIRYFGRARSLSIRRTPG